jgi:hypothetical protein
MAILTEQQPGLGGRGEDGREGGERLPEPQVPGDDRTLRDLLFALLTDPTAAGALADLLEERGDPRAQAVRDLAEVRCVVPEVAPEAGLDYPMGCGRFWSAARQQTGVRARVYPGTPLASLLPPGGEVEARVPPAGQTPGRLRAAFEQCRQELLFKVFGTTTRQVRARLVVLTHPGMDRVARTLARWRAAAVPWLCEVRAADPGRFQRILSYIWAHPALHEISAGLLDALKPGWSGPH